MVQLLCQFDKPSIKYLYIQKPVKQSNFPLKSKHRLDGLFDLEPNDRSTENQPKLELLIFSFRCPHLTITHFNIKANVETAHLISICAFMLKGSSHT